jgi:hypothetical protein
LVQTLNQPCGGRPAPEACCAKDAAGIAATANAPANADKAAFLVKFDLKIIMIPVS